MVPVLLLFLIPNLNAELHYISASKDYQLADDNVVGNLPSRKSVTIKNLNVYSYIAAIMLLDQILSTGTLINERWLISGAESVYINRDNVADVTARFGSQDYTRSGILIALSHVEVHPYFRIGSPDYDLCLLRLSHGMMLSPNIKPLKLPPKGGKLRKSHFLVPAWSKRQRVLDRWSHKGNEAGEHSRNLQFAHLHTGETYGEACVSQLRNASHAQNIICLYSAEKKDTCQKDSGGPIVSRGELWGVTTSYVPEDCELAETPTFVVMLTAPDVQVWLNTVLKSQAWRGKVQINYFTSNDEDVALSEQRA